jgi:hypothetical protein
MSATTLRDPITVAIDHCDGQPIPVQCASCSHPLQLACRIEDDARVFDVLADDPYAYDIVIDCPSCDTPIAADLVDHRGAAIA